jgi:hypothetical protein
MFGVGECELVQKDGDWCLKMGYDFFVKKCFRRFLQVLVVAKNFLV